MEYLGEKAMQMKRRFTLIFLLFLAPSLVEAEYTIESDLSMRMQREFSRSLLLFHYVGDDMPEEAKKYYAKEFVELLFLAWYYNNQGMFSYDTETVSSALNEIEENMAVDGYRTLTEDPLGLLWIYENPRIQIKLEGIYFDDQEGSTLPILALPAHLNLEDISTYERYTHLVAQFLSECVRKGVGSGE